MANLLFNTLNNSDGFSARGYHIPVSVKLTPQRFIDLGLSELVLSLTARRILSLFIRPINR